MCGARYSGAPFEPYGLLEPDHFLDNAKVSSELSYYPALSIRK